VVYSILSRLAELESPEKVLTSDEIFPIKLDDGSEVPSYQAYLCLAWLRHAGLAEQIGRQGYRFRNPIQLRSDVDQCWETLEVMD
jgi:hypothetical protein